MWGSMQNGEAGLATTSEASGLPVQKCEVLQDVPGRRLRPAFHLARLRPPSRPHRQGNARDPDQASMVARRGHDPRLVSPDHAMQDDGRLRQGQQPDRDLHFRISGQSILAGVMPDAHAERHGSGDLRGVLQGRRRRRRSANDPEPPGRPRDAQSASAAGLLARCEHQPQCDLHRELHGRACQGSGRRPARVPAQADGQLSEAPCRAQHRGAEGRLGQADAARRLSRPRAGHGVRQLRRGLRRGVGRRQQGQDPSHRRRDRSGLCGQSRPRSSGKSRARSCTA